MIMIYLALILVLLVYLLRSKKWSKKIKYKYIRFIIKFRNFRESTGSKIINLSERSISPYEEKAIRLWRMLLRDENTKMSYNSNGVRQIEKENVLMVFQHGGGNDYIMTLMDVSETGKSLYELRFPQKHADVVSDYFDDELEKRMKKSENNKRNIIENDIDKLIKEEEIILINRKKIRSN
jgi:hypothetical protein